MSSPKKNQASAGIQALILHSRVRDKLQTELSMKSNGNKETKKSKIVSTLKSKQFLQHNRKPSDSIDDEDDEEEEEAGSAEITVIRTTSHSNKKLNDLKNNNNKSLSKSTNNNNNNNSIGEKSTNNSNLDTSLLKIKSLEILNEELMEQNKSLKQQLLVSQANCSLILNELTRSKKKLNQILKKL